MAPVDTAAIDGRIAEFIERVEAERTHLFNQHLHATVRRTSPLLLGLATMEGISIAEAVSQCRPPENWPRMPHCDFPPSRLRVSQLRPIRKGSTNLHEERRFRRVFCDPGVIIRPVDDPRGRFAVRPHSGMLAFTAAIGPSLLSAFGATATLMLREPLPETVAIAMPGRPLRQLIDHPCSASIRAGCCASTPTRRPDPRSCLSGFRWCRSRSPGLKIQRELRRDVLSRIRMGSSRRRHRVASRRRRLAD